MSIRSSILVKSQKNNRYFFDKNKKKLTLCHPLFYRLIEMDQRGENLECWVRGWEGKSGEMEGIGLISAEEIRYYYKKYLLFKENGYFDLKKMDTRLSVGVGTDDVDAFLANADDIVFEVTDQCNLECGYCSFGRFYGNYAPRKNRKMDPDLAERALDFFLAKIKGLRNDSFGYRLHVGFYGGEPLLNFPLIRRIVEYVSQKKMKGLTVDFTMTTNGLLLEKYVDFLVERRFHLLISLDGNEKHNSYRVFAGGKPAFAEIVRNVEVLKNRYPEYFRKNVSFNVVLHDRNSVSEVCDFFKKHFNRLPSFSSISAMGIRDEFREEFKKIYNMVAEDLKNCSESAKLESQILFRLPEMRALLHFLRHDNSFVYINLNHLLIDEEGIKRIPSGTCMPFQKKVFITVDGRIFPCERIGQDHKLGRVDANGVHVHEDAIRRMYNGWFAALKQQCRSCYIADSCPVCMFYIDGFPQMKACQWHTEESEFRRTVSRYVDTLEKSPYMYRKILDEG